MLRQKVFDKIKTALLSEGTIKHVGLWNRQVEFLEHEGFVSGNPKRAFSNMMSHGLKQSSRLILDDAGLTDAYMKRSVYARIMKGQSIDEVWIKQGDTIRLLYKKSEE